MSVTQVKKIVRNYGRALKNAQFEFQALYLFGSQQKGNSNRWSDIDIAVVSSLLRRDKEQHRLKLWQLRQEVDVRIEPHGFTPEEFKNDANPMAYEIRKTGVRIK